MSEGSTYGGVLGAFPYAFRTSESRLFRLYAVVGTLLAAVLLVFWVLALVKAIADSPGGGSISAYRGLVILLALSVTMPVVGPILLVARRHRRSAETDDPPPTANYDRLMGALGFVFVVAGYLALVISVPESYETTPTGPLAPVVAALYDAPTLATPLPPLAVVVAMLVADRRYGRRRTDPTG